MGRMGFFIDGLNLTNDDYKDLHTGGLIYLSRGGLILLSAIVG
jgi:hypothetical protein